MPLLIVIIEIFIFVGLIDYFGFINTVLIYLIPTMIGFIIFNNFNRSLMFDIQSNQNPSKELIKKGLSFVAAILLILPSFISKVFGVFLILPFVRTLIAWGFQGLLLKKVFSRANSFTNFGGIGGNGFKFYYQKFDPNEFRSHQEQELESDVLEAQYKKIEDVNLLEPSKSDNKKDS